jgi:hypothetical protein
MQAKEFAKRLDLMLQDMRPELTAAQRANVVSYTIKISAKNENTIKAFITALPKKMQQKFHSYSL